MGAAQAAGPVSPAAGEFARRLLAADDAGGQPFAIVDKRAAQMVVFHADGSLAGTTAVLLGSVRGDHSVPGVGERASAQRLRPGDSTTPAGRFETSPGHNLSGEAVVWVDYAAALAIHRLRSGASEVGRARRLASARTDDNRASAGCVVVPVAFYETVVQPLLGRHPGVLYVMPEHGPWQTLWREIRGAGLNAGL
jgi:hypothetical protein